MLEHPRPKIVVSRCLEFEPVRYDGKVIPAKIVRDLEPYVDYIKVCPEYDIGLGVPREPIRIIRKDGKDRLVQPKTGRDVTEEMDKFTDKFLEKISDVDGFIFKSKSPTIGLKDIKIYHDAKSSSIIDRGKGFFARKIADKYDGYPMEEDDRLRNNLIRNHFLTKIFVFAKFREIKSDNSLDLLEEFHVQNELLYKVYNKEMYVGLCEIFEEYESISDVFNDYFKLLKKMFRKGPKSSDYIDMVNDVFDEYNEKLTEAESKHFRDILELYRENKICMYSLLEVMKCYLRRIEKNKLCEQSIFEPYPKELRPLIDEDRDRDFWKYSEK